MARLSSGDADYARRRAAHEEERRQEFRRSTGRSTSSFFQISQRDANAFNRAFERGMQQQIRVAGMIGIIGTASVGGYYAPGAYQLTAPHLARGYAWARSPQTRAAVQRLGVSGVQQVQGLAGQVAFPSVRTLGVSGRLGILSGIGRGLGGDYIGYDGLSGVEFGIYAPVVAPFLITDALIFEGLKRF